MLGEVVHEGMSFQLDLGATAPDGGFAVAETTVGLAHPSLFHRRVNDLELDRKQVHNKFTIIYIRTNVPHLSPLWFLECF